MRATRARLFAAGAAALAGAALVAVTTAGARGVPAGGQTEFDILIGPQVPLDPVVQPDRAGRLQSRRRRDAQRWRGHDLDRIAGGLDDRAGVPLLVDRPATGRRGPQHGNAERRPDRRRARRDERQPMLAELGLRGPDR